MSERLDRESLPNVFFVLVLQVAPTRALQVVETKRVDGRPTFWLLLLDSNGRIDDRILGQFAADRRKPNSRFLRLKIGELVGPSPFSIEPAVLAIRTAIENRIEAVAKYEADLKAAATRPASRVRSLFARRMKNILDDFPPLTTWGAAFRKAPGFPREVLLHPCKPGLPAFLVTADVDEDRRLVFTVPLSFPGQSDGSTHRVEFGPASKDTMSAISASDFLRELRPNQSAVVDSSKEAFRDFFNAAVWDWRAFLDPIKGAAPKTVHFDFDTLFGVVRPPKIPRVESYGLPPVPESFARRAFFVPDPIDTNERRFCLVAAYRERAARIELKIYPEGQKENFWMSFVYLKPGSSSLASDILDFVYRALTRPRDRCPDALFAAVHDWAVDAFTTKVGRILRDLKNPPKPTGATIAFVEETTFGAAPAVDPTRAVDVETRGLRFSSVWPRTFGAPVRHRWIVAEILPNGILHLRHEGSRRSFHGPAGWARRTISLPYAQSIYEGFFPDVAKRLPDDSSARDEVRAFRDWLRVTVREWATQKK